MRIKDERQLDKDLAAAIRSKGGYVNLRAGLHAVQTERGSTHISMARQKGAGVDVSVAGIPDSRSAVSTVANGN